MYGHAQGAYAEVLAVDPTGLLPLPKTLSFEEAAAVPVWVSHRSIRPLMARTYTTSYEGIIGRGQAKPGERGLWACPQVDDEGEWVLVHAGAGGVGLVACLIAKGATILHCSLSAHSCLAHGCRVIATASTEAKRRICHERAGVDATVDYGQKDWQVRLP